jgi:hypothetical protein
MGDPSLVTEIISPTELLTLVAAEPGPLFLRSGQCLS